MKLILIAVILLLTLGCNNDKISMLESENAELRKRVEKLEAQQADIATSSSLKGLTYDITNQLLVMDFELWAHRKGLNNNPLDLSRPNTYARLDSETGTFLVMVSDVSEYGDGYRVALNIGNIALVKYEGFTLECTWGRNKDSLPDVEKANWGKTLRQATYEFSSDLKPGTWNKVAVALPATKADQLGYFNVTLKLKNVQLTPTSYGD